MSKLRAARRRFVVQTRADEIFLVSVASTPPLRPTTPHIQCAPGALSQVINLPGGWRGGCKADRSTPSNTQTMNICVSLSTYTYTFMAYVETTLLFEIEKHGEKFSPRWKIHARSRRFILHLTEGINVNDRIVLEREKETEIERKKKAYTNTVPEINPLKTKPICFI
jgi:hypothetical protein